MEAARVVVIESVISGMCFMLSFFGSVKASRIQGRSRSLSGDFILRYISIGIVSWTFLMGFLQLAYALYWPSTRPIDRRSWLHPASTLIQSCAWIVIHMALVKRLSRWDQNQGVVTSVLLVFFAVVSVLDIVMVVSFGQWLANDTLMGDIRINVLLDLILASLRLATLVTFDVILLQFHRRHRGYSHVSSESEETEDEGNDLDRSAFSNLWDKLVKLTPFMWPKGHLKLQLAILACVVMLVLQRVLNVFVPITYKWVIDELTVPDKNHGNSTFPLVTLIIYTAVRLFQGNSGFLYTLQSTVWIPVEQYTTREVALQMFQHLHSLSLRWHLNRKTGEVLRVMDRGTTAISTLLSYIWFNIAPVLVDIIIAVVYFCIQFDLYFGIIVFITMAMYLVVTIWITEWRTKFRREKNDLDNASNAKAVDSLLNFETVKYYGNEDYEVQNYNDSILKFQKADWKNQISLRVLNLAQNVVIILGMFAGGLLCAQRVVEGTLNVGDFVLFMAYIQQLYQPLNWFGSYYRAINQNFVDMEKMMDLFDENAEVKDFPGAVELKLTEGRVVFENVCFTYDPKKTEIPSIKNVSFEIPPGKTVALVGQSGGGKSTILRLLFRFYDVQEGRILVDGQDIRQVTQQSLRKSIGVVPQDTVLFNDTILYNIRYGKVEATDQAAEKVAAMAQIHDKINSFPEKYQTMVGERGLRLSGGEKQRIAIARTLLKDPKIVLLDEATSSLDINTERAIQAQLNQVTSGRTTLVVAHRLSTIVNADQILVIRDGQIVEHGTHSELMRLKGLYHEMWLKQSDNAQESASPQQ